MNRRNPNLAILAVTLVLVCCLQLSAQQPGPTTTSPVAPAPSGNNPHTQGPEPGSNARPVTPAGQIEQSVQPVTQADQQSRGTSPTPVTQPQTQTGGGTTSSIPMTDSLPSDTNFTPVSTPSVRPSHERPSGETIVPAAPQPGRTAIAAPVLETENLATIPAIAPEYRAPARPLPEIGRVGVDIADQRP